MAETLEVARTALNQLLLEGESDIVYNPQTQRYEDLKDTIVPRSSDEDKPHALEAPRRRLKVHRSPEDAIPYRPKPQIRSISPLPYRPGPNLRKPEKQPPKVQSPKKVVYVSTPEDGEVRLYRGDRCAFMRSVGIQKNGKWKTRPKSSPADAEGKIIIPTKYQGKEQQVPDPNWAHEVIQEAHRTDPKDASTPAHWWGVSRAIRKESLRFPPFSNGLPYPTDLHFPPAEYRPQVDDNRQPIGMAVAALDEIPCANPFKGTTDNPPLSQSQLPQIPSRGSQTEEVHLTDRRPDVREEGDKEETEGGQRREESPRPPRCSTPRSPLPSR